jgi:hypothetical protein
MSITHTHTRTARGLGVAMAFGLVASALTATAPAPASTSTSSAVPGLVRVLASSANNSASPKTVIATCPGNKRLTGTGARIDGGGGEVALNDLTPNQALTSNTVTAYEADPTAANWRVTAYALCADPLPGRVLATAASALNSASPKTRTAPCPAGKRLTGTGARIDGGGSEVALNDLTPDATPGSTTATAFEEDPTTANWRVTAFAICATR